MTFRGGIISVGGSWQPIVISLNEPRPEFVLFLVSAGSKIEVQKNILPALAYAPQYNCAQVSDEGDLAACYETARAAIPRWLRDRDLEPSEVYVDITGATKPMSAGLAMAAAEWFSHFTYIRGRERDKGGLGVVVSGSEEVFRTVNPWDKLASRERDRATWLFRSGYAEAAAEQLRNAAGKCSPELQHELKTLAELADCFASADRFQFENISHSYGKIRDKLNLIFSHRGQHQLFVDIEQLAEHWKKLAQERQSEGIAPSTVSELLANAKRRAAQGRYDDAIGRLYRAPELFAQGKLHEAFGAKLGKVHVSRIPPERLNEWRAKFGDADGEFYPLGAKDAFQALGFSPNPALHALAGRYDSIANHLQKRNSSILAHGLRPATQEDFQAFWVDLLPIVQVKEEEVPRWPEIAF